MNIRKRLLSLLVCACMVLALLPATAFAYDISGGIDVRDATGNQSWGSGTDTAVWDNSTYTLTLSGNINISPWQNAAIRLPAESTLVVAGSATVNLQGGTGTNTGYNAVSCEGNLNVEVGEKATLNAIGGNTDSTYAAGGGIHSSATLTVEVKAGGVLNATGGTSTGNTSANGYGLSGASGVTLSGSGTVRAVSRYCALYSGSILIKSGVSGYALGGISGTYSYTDTITNSAPGFFIGAGTEASTDLTSSNLSSLTGNTYWLDSTSKNLLAHFDYTASLRKLTMFNLTIANGETLTIPTGVTATLPSDKTLTNNGSITNSGTLTVGGTLSGTGSITSTGDLTVGGLTVKASNGGSVTYKGDANAADAGFRLTENGDYTISGTWNGGNLGATADAARAVVTVARGVNADVTLNGATIISYGVHSTRICAFDMTGATVDMTVLGTNELSSFSDRAGIEAPVGSTLTIGGSGSLGAYGSFDGAGIGGTGGDGGGTPTAGGEITIQGNVTVEASGYYGAGIGGGGSGTAGQNGGAGGTIAIKGNAKVTASSSSGAGVGGGGSTGSTTSGSGGSITIEGNAQVEASSTQGAGIGAGFPAGQGTWGSAGTITIKGGSVTATSVYNSGVGGDGGSVTISPASGTQIAVRVGASEDGSNAAPVSGSPFSGTEDISALVLNSGEYFHSETAAVPAPSGGGTSYYTLTFDTNDGNQISSLHRARGTTIDLSGYTTTREGYVFAGWYVDEELTEKITELRLTRNTTVYAGWNWINPFIDVHEDDWFYEAVRYVYERGLMNGTSADTFSPDISATRAMLAMITWRMEGSPAPSGANPFTDVAAGEWYTEAVIWCAAEDIMTGYGGGLFGPNDPITRQQLAALLYRYAQYKGWDVSVGEDTNILSYTDFDQISEWAIPAIQWAVGAGIMEGKTASALDPRGEATRAEIAMMLMRLLEKYDPDFALPAGAASLPATGIYSTLEPPKTGDSTSGVGFAMLALPVAAGAAYCTRRLRRRRDDEQPDPNPA